MPVNEVVKRKQARNSTNEVKEIVEAMERLKAKVVDVQLDYDDLHRRMVNAGVEEITMTSCAALLSTKTTRVYVDQDAVRSHFGLRIAKQKGDDEKTVVIVRMSAHV